MVKNNEGQGSNLVSVFGSDGELIKKAITKQQAEIILRSEGFVPVPKKSFWRRSSDREYRNVLPYQG